MSKFYANPKAYLALLAVYAIWSTTLASMHIGTETIPVVMLPCARFMLAGGLLILYCLLRGEKLPDMADTRNHFIIGALLFVGGNTVVTWALKYLTTGVAGLLVATTPFCMVAMAASIPPREKITTGSLVGILLGFSGIVILFLPQLMHPMKVNFHFWLAIGAMLFTTFSWSLGSILLKQLPTKSSVLMSVGMQNILAGLTLVPVVAFTVKDWNIHPSTQSIWAVIYLATFGTMFATPCYLYVMRHLSVSVASTFAYVTPVGTVLVGALLLGEKVTPLTAAGSFIILCGVAVVQIMGRKQAEEISEAFVDAEIIAPEIEPAIKPAPAGAS